MSRGDSNVEVDRDHTRRELAEIDAGHHETLRPTADLIDHLYQTETPAQTKWDVLAGGINRTGVVKIGGVAVLTTAVLAACGSDDEGGASGGAPVSTAAPAAAADLRVLRFAASFENVAVAAYEKAAPLLTTPAVKDVAKLFMGHHKDHAAQFNAAAKSLGGQEFTTPNPAVQAALDPQIQALRTEADVLNFALELEAIAAATYFSTVSGLKGEKLAYAAMAIGATEYRHARFLADALKKDVPGEARGFLTSTKAQAVVGI